MTDNSIDFLNQLESVIAQRKATATEKSYTAELFAAGRSRIAQKVGEEAVELVIASMQNDDARTISEAADLVYHLLVLLRDQDLSLADVSAELRRRHTQ
jgi:phosphoribosyl-ATP pyrophosphohydrolase